MTLKDQVQMSRSPQGQMSRSFDYKVTRSLCYSTDILLFMALTFTLDIWPWANSDLDLKMTFIGQGQGHLKVKCRGQGHYITRSQGNCVTLKTSYCSCPWPLPWTFDLETILNLTSKWPSKIKVKCQGHLKGKYRGQGHFITRSQGHCVTLQTILFMALAFTMDIWPWDNPDLDL